MSFNCCLYWCLSFLLFVILLFSFSGFFFSFIFSYFFSFDFLFLHYLTFYYFFLRFFFFFDSQVARLFAPPSRCRYYLNFPFLLVFGSFGICLSQKNFYFLVWTLPMINNKYSKARRPHLSRDLH